MRSGCASARVAYRRRREPAVGRRAHRQAELGQPLGEGCEPQVPAIAATRHTGREAAHQDHTPRVSVVHVDVGGDHAREVDAVLRVVAIALRDDGARAIDSSPVDLDRVPDRDVGAGERRLVRAQYPVATDAHVDDVQMTPGDAVGGDDEIVNIAGRTGVPGDGTGGIARGRAEDAAHARPVGVGGDSALVHAVASRGEDDLIAQASVDPTRAIGVKRLAGEDRRRVDRCRAVRGREGVHDPDGSVAQRHHQQAESEKAQEA